MLPLLFRCCFSVITFLIVYKRMLIDIGWLNFFLQFFCIGGGALLNPNFFWYAEIIFMCKDNSYIVDNRRGMQPKRHGDRASYGAVAEWLILKIPIFLIGPLIEGLKLCWWFPIPSILMWKCLKFDYLLRLSIFGESVTPYLTLPYSGMRILQCKL